MLINDTKIVIFSININYNGVPTAVIIRNSYEKKLLFEYSDILT